MSTVATHLRALIQAMHADHQLEIEIFQRIAEIADRRLQSHNEIVAALGHLVTEIRDESAPMAGLDQAQSAIDDEWEQMRAEARRPIPPPPPPSSYN